MQPKKFSKIGSHIKAGISKHSPEILIGVGIAGMLTTTVLAVKATPKALTLIEEKKKEKGLERLTVVDTVKATYKCYLPAAGLAAASIACLVGSNKISAKRTAVMTTAYTIADTAYREYRSKVIETIGEKKEEAIRDKIAKDKIEKNPVEKNEVVIIDKGNTLCYDVLSGRYFKTDIDKIKKAENELNRTLIYDMYVSLNDFYRKVGLEELPLGDELGWKCDDGLLELSLSSQLTSNDEPCLVINFNVSPRYDYYKLG